MALVTGGAAIHGSFIIDEAHYLSSLAALRAGSLHIPGTEGLPPTAALAAHIPGLHDLRVDSTPIYPQVPPLWALLAWPLTPLGYTGLFWCNALSFGGLVYMLDRWAVELGLSPAKRLGASITFVLGGFMAEYAMAVWPHALSSLLLFSGFRAVSRWRSSGERVWLPMAGLACGLAAGVRYQNLVPAAAIGLSAALLPHRGHGLSEVPGCSHRAMRAARSLAGFCVGLAPPLLLTSAINHARFGVFHPAWKAAGYITVGKVVHGETESRFVSTFRAFWMRVVDYRAHPEFTEAFADAHRWMRRDPDSGAILIGKLLKKSLLQSAPWAALGILMLLWVWRGPRPSEARRELRAASLVMGAVLALFAVAGPLRNDGLCFNQRYLIELLPLLSVAAMAAMPEPDRRSIVVATVAAIPVAFAGHALGAGGAPSAWWLSVAPLVIGACLVLVRLGGRFSPTPTRWAVHAYFAYGCAVGWGLGVHMGDDLRASRAVRAHNADLLALVREHVPPESALLAYSSRDAFAPMVLTRRLLLIDPSADRSRSAPALVDALLARRQRVFIWRRGAPQDLFDLALGGRTTRDVVSFADQPALVEVLPREGGADEGIEAGPRSVD